MGHDPPRQADLPGRKPGDDRGEDGMGAGLQQRQQAQLGKAAAPTRGRRTAGRLASALIEPERFRAPLAEATTRLRLNRRLVTLNLALPLPPVHQTPADTAALLAFLREMEMRTTLAEAEKRYGQPELF